MSKKRSKSKKPKRSKSKKPKRSKSKKPKRSKSKKPKRSKSKKPKRSKSKKPKRSKSKIKNKNYILLQGYTKRLTELTLNELKYYAKLNNIKITNLNKNNIIEKIGDYVNKIKVGNNNLELNMPLNKNQIQKLSKADMINVLKYINVIIGIPQTKPDLAKLLQRKKCSPINKKFCDDGICDIRNNICMPPDFKKRGLTTLKIDGKHIIGTKKTIHNLKIQMEKQLVNNEVNNEVNNDQIDQIELIEDEDEDEDIVNLLPNDPNDPIDLKDPHEFKRYKRSAR